MDTLWVKQATKLRADGAKRGDLFDVGNYAMFIQRGLYSQVANKVDGKTYYGIGEWIMHKRMAGIPKDKYKDLAKDAGINPTAGRSLIFQTEPPKNWLRLLRLL